MYFTPIWLLVVLEATLVSVINVDGAFYDLSEVMDDDESLLMARSAGGRSFGRFREQIAQLQPTDTSKTTRASLFLPGTGGFLGGSQPARTILVTPAATSGALTATAACCPCTGATSGALIAPVSPGIGGGLGRLTAATGGFGWPSGFSAGFTSLPAVSTFPAVSGQLIAPLYLSSPQQQQQQQQQIQQPSQQQMINHGQSRLGYSSSDEGQVESLADGKRKTRRLSSHSRTQVG